MDEMYDDLNEETVQRPIAKQAGDNGVVHVAGKSGQNDRYDLVPAVDSPSPAVSNTSLSLLQRPRPVSGPLTLAPAPSSRRARVNRVLLIKRRHMRQERREKTTPRLLIALFVASALLVALCSSGAGVAFAYYKAQLPLLDHIATHSLFQTTHIYDRNGNLLYSLNDPRYGRRTYDDYNQISPNMVNATVAAEDHTFWTNSGIDVQGILRAALTNLQNQAIVEGGSTITQQLIKNQLFPTDPRTLQVKGEEAILAYGLTQNYPKWKIMEMYLNTVYYGDLNYGVEAAAQDFFNLQPKCNNKTCRSAASQLDLAQAALLAGLPRSPSYYDPITNKSVALARQAEVLQSMVELNMITPKQAKQAEAEMAKFHFKSYSSLQGIQAPHFVQYVIDSVLAPMIGAQNLYDGGYNIYTTLDLNLEKKIERIVYSHLYQVQCDNYLGCYGPLDTTNNVNNAAVVVENPADGEILAMDGSANYNDSRPQVAGRFNAATALRQPGSSFKPIVYATAFEMGWYPAMILPNHKTTYPTIVSYNPLQYYSPSNYGNVYLSGFPMTIRNAIANSINIPAVDAIEFAGIQNVVNTAGRLGLTEVSSKPLSELGPSMAIGGTEVSLLHLTGAYAAFADQGVRVPQTTILEITNNLGQVLYKYDQAHPHGVQALPADVAFLMSSILSDRTSRYHEFGPGNPLEEDFPVAAKTGTTDSFRDNWTMGYTPYLAIGVWAGNSDNSLMNNVIGITGAGPIWHDVMAYATNYYHYPPSDFIRPPDVHAGTVSALTGLLPHPGEPTVTDWFIDGTMPTIQGSYSAPVKGCDRHDCQQPPQPVQPPCTPVVCIQPPGQ
jgi:membrane peptidoglycan carboxypeptidase